MIRSGMESWYIGIGLSKISGANSRVKRAHKQDRGGLSSYQRARDKYRLQVDSANIRFM